MSEHEFTVIGIFESADQARRAAGELITLIERIRAWRAGDRPVVGPDPRFRLGTVAAEWRKILA